MTYENSPSISQPEPMVPPVSNATVEARPAGLASPSPAFSAGSLPTIAVTPRTRWAAIIWGLIFAGVAGAGIWLLLGDIDTEALIPFVMRLTPLTIGIYVVLVIAVLAVIAALIALIRHAQKTFTARNARS